MTPPEQELYLLVERSPIGMYRSDAAGAIHYANSALARLLGYSVEELLQKNLNRDVYVDPTERERLIEIYRPRGVVDGAAVSWKTRDGRVLKVRIWGHVVETDRGPSYDASVLDVTELELHRDELERGAKILEQSLRQMPAIYWVCDRNLTILRTGGAISELLGYDPDRFVGTTMADSVRQEPGSVDAVATHKRALAGETFSYDNEYRGKQFQITLAPYRIADGSIIGVIGTSFDVTSSRQLERRMIDAQRAESLGVLAGGLAHDFNNLLVAVIGNADLALREIPNGTPGRGVVENIRDAGLRAAELTNQLLTYAGQGGAGTTRVFPAEIVDELLRITAPSIPPELHVAIDIPANLSLRGDPAQLRQVLMNLINNARDALGGRGSIAIRARSIHHDGVPSTDDVLGTAAGDYISLEVADDGPGMDDDTRRHAFEPFFTTKQTGHGLGLAAVIGIMRAHHGGVRVRTTRDTGTCFQILWPAADAPNRPATPPPAVPTRTVLVIDDEDLVRDVVARMIEDLGYAAVTAGDGQAGLDLLDHRAIDAVLVDLTMPRMSGADVLVAVRARRPGLPVIVCSGFDRHQRGPVHADAYLAKPFRIDVLERTLAKLLPP